MAPKAARAASRISSREVTPATDIGQSGRQYRNTPARAARATRSPTKPTTGPSNSVAGPSNIRGFSAIDDLDVPSGRFVRSARAAHAYGKGARDATSNVLGNTGTSLTTALNQQLGSQQLGSLGQENDLAFQRVEQNTPRFDAVPEDRAASKLYEVADESVIEKSYETESRGTAFILRGPEDAARVVPPRILLVLRRRFLEGLRFAISVILNYGLKAFWLLALGLPILLLLQTTYKHLPANFKPFPIHIFVPRDNSTSGSFMWKTIDGVKQDVKTINTRLDNDSEAMMLLDVRMKSITDRLQNQATSHLIAMQGVNYFSEHLGARIDQVWTSPTKLISKRLPAFMYQSIFYRSGQLPAATALRPWTEAGDCWCAATSLGGNRGLASLGVTIPYIIKPQTITIEHAPKDATLDITSAPKDVEVWGQVAQDGGNYDYLHGVCEMDGPAGEGWKCLGRVRYSITAVSHVQTLRLQNQDVPVSRFAILVTSNHGKDYSCLYRVQMHGDRVKSLGDE